MNKQRGMSFWGVSTMLVGVVFVAVIVMKLAPAYIEYFAVKRAFASIKSQIAGGELSRKDIITAFEHQATIDSIKVITSKDLVIEQSTGGTVVSVEYQVVTPLMGNVSALIDFSLSTDESADQAAE